MDTTKTCILQCEKAFEVQKLRNPSDGDWFHGSGNSISKFYFNHQIHRKTDFMSDWFIWLPRQDQLQGMVMDDDDNKSAWTLKFHKFVSEGFKINIFWSMEQLWLAFVMNEKFNKTWDGKDWT